MNTTYRPFVHQADKLQMAALARQFPASNLHITDLPYRFSSWAFDDSENIRLWFDENQQLLAWAVLQAPWWTIDYACHPIAEASLHPAILAWADQRAHLVANTPFERPSWFMVAFPGQTGRIHDLEAAGFKFRSDVGEDSWSKVLLRRSTHTLVKVYQPPAGFTVRPLAGESEVEAYVELHRSVFETKTMTAEWRARTLKHPAYRPDLDLVVEAPDGSLAAFCICWLDESAMEGQVEPLGCRKEFRRYALGRVALSHGLQRLQSLGVQSIVVETDCYRNTAYRLYEAFDFEVVQNVLIYGKDYQEGET
jgi:ribosomal protein S18 acetylase RimI-like enzyme